MPFDPEKLPADLKKQRGLTRSSPGFMNRDVMTQFYAKHASKSGEPATVDDIRALLVWVDRGYSLKIDQISRALAYSYRSGRVDKYTSNGQPGLIDGTKFSTVRKAGQSLGVSPQTVLNRIKSDRPEWAGWQRA